MIFTAGFLKHSQHTVLVFSLQRVCTGCSVPDESFSSHTTQSASYLPSLPPLRIFPLILRKILLFEKFYILEVGNKFYAPDMQNPWAVFRGCMVNDQVLQCGEIWSCATATPVFSSGFRSCQQAKKTQHSNSVVFECARTWFDRPS